MNPTARHRLTLSAVVLILTAFCQFGASAKDSATSEAFGARQIELGNHLLHVEIAETESQRRVGLMHRTSLPADGGMLFVYPEATQICMWMKNTLIPLDVAFYDEQGLLLNVESMEPLTLNPHCSAGSSKFALEMNQGWFGAQKPGTFNQLKIIGASADRPASRH